MFRNEELCCFYITEENNENEYPHKITPGYYFPGCKHGKYFRAGISLKIL